MNEGHDVIDDSSVKEVVDAQPEILNNRPFYVTNWSIMVTFQSLKYCIVAKIL